MNSVYCVFPGGKFKALTLSYDDNSPESNRKLMEIFRKYSIKATFFLNSGLYPDDDDRWEIKSMYEGFEVACHTRTHPTIARCPVTEVIDQILGDRKALEAAVGYPVRGLSYPNRSMSPEITSLLPLTGIRYAREGETTGNFGLPQDLLHWKGTCHHNQNLLEKADEFISLFKWQYLYLFYVWGHSFEFARDGNWDMMEEFCRKVGGRDDVWYCTNIEYVDYMEAFKRLQFAADNSFVFNPNAMDVFILVNGQNTVKIPGGHTVRL